MIFTPTNAALVMSGRKTQTRRPVKAGEHRAPYQVGRGYAVQPGRGKPGIGHIRITRVRMEQVQYISSRDCRAECAKTLLDYARIWDGIYHATEYRWSANPWVRVYTFEVID